MLCCIDSFGGGDDYGQQSSGVSAYPGRRNDLVPTAGNALAAPPSFQQQSSVGGSNKEMIKVTVPAGVSAGQPLHVNAPDGRMIQAVVPHGYGPGSSFLVELPPRTGTLPSNNGFSPPLANNPASKLFAQAHPVGAQTQPSAPPPTPGGQALMNVKVPPGIAPGTTLHVRVPGEDRVIAAVVPPGVSEFQVAYDRIPPPSASQPFSAALSAPSAPAMPSQPFSQPLSSSAPPAPSAAASRPFSLALDNPPPTAPQATNSAGPGAYSTAASKPFSTALNPSAASAPLPAPMPVQPQYLPSSNEKLMLVRVPPGTAPGSTLHVSIPDEPGRLIAAKVPPGVSEFHVSYIPNH